MNDVALVAQQIRYEQKSYWRNPPAAFFTFAFPLMLLLIFGAIDNGAHIKALGDISYNQYFTPAILTYGVMSASYTSLAINLIFRRETGVLKRMRGTPLPAWGLLGGLFGSALVVALIGSVLTVALGVAIYDVHLPYHVLALVGTLLAGAAAFCAIGVAVANLVPNEDAGPAIVNFPFIGLSFLSGTFFPLPAHSVLAKIANVFPLSHFTKAVFLSFDPRPAARHGTGWDGHDLLILAVWLVAASVIAVRSFRWEPRR